MNNNTHKILLYSSVFILVTTWLYVIFSYSNLPDKIVGHMDFSGNVTRYDDKNIIWLIPAIFTLLSYGVYWLSNQKHNDKNQLKDPAKSKIATLMSLPYLALIAFGLVYTMINKSVNPDFNTYNFMYLSLFLTIILLITLIAYIYKNAKS